jgi:positive regulator of sigma E activity
MKYLKYTPYIYLFAAIFFIYKALDAWNAKSEEHLLFLGIATLSVFMFFFRRHYAKKFEARNKSK